MNASDLYTNALTVSDDMCAICRYSSEETCDRCPVRKTLEDLRDEYDAEQAGLSSTEDNRALSVDDFDPADVADAIKRYNDNYDFLYENIDYLPDCLQTALTNAGDMAIKHNREFASVFCAMRGDLMSSDREAAAFAMTFPHLITLETSC